MATLRLAHRGDWRRARENTLAALLAAAAVPACDGVEFDVRLSLDGVPVLQHDDTLERVWGRPERVDGLRADTLFDLGIPALTDVLGALPRSTFLDVELKGPHDRAVIEVLASGRGADLQRAAISSFSKTTLERVAGLAPAWPRWLNARDLEPATLSAAAELECRGVSARWDAIDDRGLAAARRLDLDVVAYTVRRRPTFARLARQGVAVVCVEAAALDG